MATVYRYIRRNDDNTETWFCVGSKDDIYDELPTFKNIEAVTTTIKMRYVDASQLPPMEQYPKAADELFAMFEAAAFDATKGGV